jgi:hypothetical protein
VKSKANSPAYKLLAMVWDHRCGATQGSWDRVNHSMRDALTLAIKAGMLFDRDDFAAFASEFHSHFWLRADGGDMLGECFYRLALVMGNQSAVLSFEAWKQRPPFIVDRICSPEWGCDQGHFHPHATGRLALGYRFVWLDLLVTVTSFATDGQSITACTYKASPKGEYAPRRIARRFKITIDELRAEMSLRRKALKAPAEHGAAGGQ